MAITHSKLILSDIVNRRIPPEPWAEGEKIPWNEPGFSERMLDEHLSQNHDKASRRFEIIDHHVSFIHGRILEAKTCHILDLGCGPGLYTSRLAALGHECLGIDFSPASIAYARQQADDRGLSCRYLEQDVRVADFGAGYGLVMMIYGEINVFRPRDVRSILTRAHRALVNGGRILLEAHSLDLVRLIGEEKASWASAGRGLFSDRPHLCLREGHWDKRRQVATERYYIIDGKTHEVTRYAASTQGYTEDEYRSLLEECGFGDIEFMPSLEGQAGGHSPDFQVIVARKTTSAR